MTHAADGLPEEPDRHPSLVPTNSPVPLFPCLLSDKQDMLLAKFHVPSSPPSPPIPNHFNLIVSVLALVD